jgi:hypothetical protein
MSQTSRNDDIDRNGNNSYWQSEGSSDENTETSPLRVDIETLPSRKRSRLAADEVSTSVYDFFRGET